MVEITNAEEDNEYIRLKYNISVDKDLPVADFIDKYQPCIDIKYHQKYIISNITEEMYKFINYCRVHKNNPDYVNGFIYDWIELFGLDTTNIEIKQALLSLISE